MPVALQTPGFHHITLRCTDLARSRRFYVDTLGFPVLLDDPAVLVIQIGSSALGLRPPDVKTPKGDVFNPFRAGLDHVALICADEKELARVAKALSAAGVENTGVKKDPTLGKKYVAFKDPDRISWEFYMA
jgi:catechol 2,3-dioxygenase-like lactoylglutathione lyase family enzyme